MADYFISYTAADVRWAEWIAWVLEEKQKYTTKLQAWDFVPGSNFVLEMQNAASSTSRTIAVLSPDYLRSTYAKPEWTAAFAQDPEGMKRKLVPVMVKDCTLDGLLKNHAEKAAIPFPGNAGGTESRSLGRPSIPRLKGMIFDLDRARFLKQSFHIIRQYFRDGIEELGTQPAVDVEFTDISATVFTAEVFINGRKVARCKIWFGEGSFANQICYYEGHDNYGNSVNEALSIARDELCFSTMMQMGFHRTEAVKNMNLNKLSPEEAAEYLWQRFISKLSYV